MKITRRELSLLIEKYILEQDDLEPLEDDTEDEFEEELEELPDEEGVAAEEEVEPDEETGVEAEAAPEGINIKLSFTLPNSDTKAKVNIEDGTAQVVFKKSNGKLVDLNKKLEMNPGAKKEIEQDIIGTMMAAIEKIKAPDSVNKIRATLSAMLGKEGDDSFIDGDHNLASMKSNVIAKYGKND